MTSDLQPGASFDQYVLERRLGGGGFGEVWLSRSASGAQVALKVMTGQYASSEVAGLRAEIELLAAQASSRSRHIVRVLGGGSEPAPFVVMEYIEGEDLSRQIARRGSLPIEEVFDIAEGIADALAALQRAGIIHRDIKPANVIIDKQGVVKLTDFGIAKIVGVDSATATGQISLSMAYAAPEVWDGKASQLSDHYAFGALLFQCITGRPVFNGNYAEIYRHHLQTPPDLDALPEGTPFALRDMIGDCLAKAPEQRPQNATLLLTAIQAARQELMGGGAATVFVTRNVEPKRLGPWLIESRAADREWTFICRHQTSGEKAVLELHFSDDLQYSEVLRKAVEVNSLLYALGGERLLATSRVILRPGEAWPNAPNAEFQFWVAREVLPPVPPPRPISPAELRKVTEALNEFLAVANVNDLSLDMSSQSLALRPDTSVLVRRPGLPPFPATDPTTDVIAFLESLPLDRQAVVPSPVNTAMPAPRETPAANHAFERTPARAGASAVAEPAVAPAAFARPPRKATGGSKKLVFAGAGIAAVAAVAVAAFLVLGSSTSHSNTKSPFASVSDGAATDYPSPPSASSSSSSASPDSAAFVKQGIAAYVAKDYDGANKLFTQAISSDGKNAEAYWRRGISFVALVKPDLALPDFSKAIELDPSMPGYYVARADLYRAQKKSDLSMADYSKAIDVDAKNFNAYFGRAGLYGELGNLDAAIADLTKAIDINGKSSSAYNNRGVVYRRQGKSDLAIQDFSKAIELDPRNYLPFANRGALDYDVKRFDDSVADYSKAIELSPTAVHYNGRGAAYSALNKPDLAAADFTKAIQTDAKFSLAYYNRSLYYYNQKRYDDALADVTRAIQLDAGYYLAYMHRGNLYKIQGNTDLARADFEKAKTLAKTQDETQRAQTQIDSLR